MHPYIKVTNTTVGDLFRELGQAVPAAGIEDFKASAHAAASLGEASGALGKYLSRRAAAELGDDDDDNSLAASSLGAGKILSKITRAIDEVRRCKLTLT